ncbi:hypothetical protein I3843_Q063400 [Carya illinoinensis]|nr:hypothetical protein I3843_Q063400 [Carya illinoinensis]
MKNLLKKLHIMSNQSEDADGSTTSKGNNSNEGSPDRLLHSRSHHNPEHKPLMGLSGWLNSVANRGKKMEPSDLASPGELEAVLDGARPDSGSSNSRDPDIEEEYQIQLALELSAREDPEAVQIEAVKQISLGSCAIDNTPAEVVAYRYWNYNSLSYDDKILDGFYDLYGVMAESTSERMPSLVDLQGTPVSDRVTWEAVLVNRAADANLLKLEQRALELAVKSRSNSLVFVGSNLVRKLAILVADYMGGPVGDPESMLRAWQSLIYSLKATLGSMVLPLGSLTIGLARHRALLFKVLADSVGLPCRLVKGQQYTGSDDVAMNFVKIDDEREYIVDLMADPGTLIPSDTAGSHIEYGESFYPASPLSRDIDFSYMASSSSGIGSSLEEQSDFGTSDKRSRFSNSVALVKETEDTEHKSSPDDFISPSNLEKVPVQENPGKSSHSYIRARSPSWTEGVSSPAVRRMKVKDVSQYMIDAAKENPQLAQKLHDVLLESGVVAPPNLFTEIYQEQLDVLAGSGNQGFKGQEDLVHSKAHISSGHLDTGEVTSSPIPSQSEAAHVKYTKMYLLLLLQQQQQLFQALRSNLELPVAAAATATAAAVVATSAAVSKQYEQVARSDGDADVARYDPCGYGDRHNDQSGAILEGERISDGSAGNDSTKSDSALDEVAECEISWEEITLGERIGLGSYGEVYRGDWHGTEVAVKRFLDQDIYGQALEEFKSEVLLMKRLRHPNVVLFMGAVTRPPNLSIVTEFLPRYVNTCSNHNCDIILVTNIWKSMCAIP